MKLSRILFKNLRLTALLAVIGFSFTFFSGVALAADAADKPADVSLGGGRAGAIGDNQCGNYDDQDRNVKTKFNFGCLGKDGPKNISPIEDFAYAMIRFLSIGVGVVVVLSIIVAGIQYASSAGNPETTGKAKNRIQQTVIGLFLYIFAYSVLQFFIPGGIFKPGVWVDPYIIQRMLM